MLSPFALLMSFVSIGRQSDGCADNVQLAPSGEAISDIPPLYLAVYRQAAARYGLGADGWAWLAGIGFIETTHGTSSLPGVHSGSNSVGAAGPMQFMPGTWADYGVDANQDGQRNKYDPADAIPGAANYLRASGAPNRWRAALWAYNHSTQYADDVTAAKNRYLGQQRLIANSFVSQGPAIPESPQPAGMVTVLQPTQPPGPIISTPADHRQPGWALGNWQSDNAVDIAVPAGTTVIAVDAGTITKLGGSPPTRGAGAIGGWNITLTTAEDRYFYTHLTARNVHVGQRVQAGQVIGRSGYANNVDHLHIGIEHANPMDLWGNGIPSDATATPNNQCDTPLTATGPAALDSAERLEQPRTYTRLPDRTTATGFPTQEVDTRIYRDAVWLIDTYNMRVTAAREDGHRSHGDGTSLDLIPAPGARWEQTTERAARDVGWTPDCGASGVPPACPVKPWVRFVGYNGYPGHGDPAHCSGGCHPHLHISWDNSAGSTSALVPPAKWVRAFPTPLMTTLQPSSGRPS